MTSPGPTVYHPISYPGAGFDLKLGYAAFNAESKEEVKVVSQDDVKLFVRSRPDFSRSQRQVM